MEILHIAVPGAILLVGFAIAIFWWAVKHGQFDDLERQGMNILLDEAPKKKPKQANNSPPQKPASDTHNAVSMSKSSNPQSPTRDA